MIELFRYLKIWLHQNNPPLRLISYPFPKLDLTENPVQNYALMTIKIEIKGKKGASF